MGPRPSAEPRKWVSKGRYAKSEFIPSWGIPLLKVEAWRSTLERVKSPILHILLAGFMG